jgi:replication-associated recombination protein RarA
MVKKVKKRRPKLPNELIIIENPDKTWHEKWTTNRNMLNIPHPFRALMLGPPNNGKTMVIKNILVRAKPAFEEIFVIHADPNFTKEYDDIEVNMLDEIPPLEEWEGEVKTLVIIDDIDLTQLNKEQKKNLNRLFGNVSTHKNISVMLTSQDPFNVPPSIRRMSNLFILWKSKDLDSLSQIARKAGMTSEDMRNLFNTILSERFDSLWIDSTTDTPFPMRKNGFIKINKIENEKVNMDFKTEKK